jgi:EAL domain-containing protein (putative c-di-GMP-specific phosphodiesterase class I)
MNQIHAHSATLSCQPGELLQPHSIAIVRAVAAMGESLGLQVIAEGIETLEQANAVAALGCNEGQGYLYGRPVDGQTL